MNYPRWVVLSDGTCPTEDIYFLKSVAPWLQSRGIEVKRIDTSYWRLPVMCMPWLVGELRNAHILVCRSLNGAWISWLEDNRHRVATIRYLIDDDIDAAALDEQLPETYRRRMAHVSSHVQPRLLAIADEVIACCEPLAKHFSQRHDSVSLLAPSLIAPMPTHDHFIQSAPRVGFHGSRAHLADLENITPALVDIHERNKALVFEIMLGGFSPVSLRGLQRVRTPKPLGWRAFQRYRDRQRMHISLTPMRDTPFNAGKTYIKFLDNAAMGSVGLYSARSPYREIVSQGEDGLLVEDTPEAWRSAMQQLIDDPVGARRMAQNAARKALDIGNPEKARAFWWVRR